MLPALIAAGSSLIGGIMGSRERAKDRSMQQEFAKQGIQWKVEDAKKAGIHPLAALGAQTTSYAPVSVGQPSIASGIASAGQDISRAVDATRGTGARLDAYTKTVQDLNLTRMGLENQLLGSQIAKINQAGTPPPMPGTDRFLIDGQSNSPLVSDKPLERVLSAGGQPSTEPGAVTDMGFSRTPTGWAPIQSKDFHDRAEEDFWAGLAWNIRNRLMPSFGSVNPPAGVPLDSGEYWTFNPFRQEYSKAKTKARLGIGRYHYRQQ